MHFPKPITLNNGRNIPQLGFGTLERENKDKIQPAVELALETGYRLVDCAQAYNNEREVGRALAASGLQRSDYLVESKLWVTEYGTDETLRAFDKSLEKLGIDYMDIFLLHWAMPMKFEKTLAAYRACERLVREGRIHSLGVANFQPSHLERLLEQVETVPVVNQIEIHPRFIQNKLRAENTRRGIVTEAWSPLGLPVRRTAASLDPLSSPEIASIVAAHGKTPAQIVLRWHMQRGDVAIPKSVTPERIRENFDIFDFELSRDEVAVIDALDTGSRFGGDPDVTQEDTYPIRVED